MLLCPAILSALSSSCWLFGAFSDKLNNNESPNFKHLVNVAVFRGRKKINHSKRNFAREQRSRAYSREPNWILIGYDGVSMTCCRFCSGSALLAFSSYHRR